jgi:glycosyltransferase involved in cell wall biosynthesis
MDCKVSICCLTFNHAAYLEKCLQGFLMQQCNFTFEVLIHEDASTDETASILKKYEAKYPHIIKPIYQTENQFKKGISPTIRFNFPRCKGKYIAFCEGDDYWTDPYKLQKQVDFLESHPDYSICWTHYKEEKENSLVPLSYPDWRLQIDPNQPISFDLNTIFTPYCTYTLTALFRAKCLDISFIEKLKYFKDNTLYALCLTSGKGILLPETTAVYRMHEGGVYSSASEYVQRYFSYLNLKEIVEKIPGCNTSNLIDIRNGLLRLSFKTHPSQKSKDYFMLILEGFKTLGIRETLVLIKKKFKGEPI